MSEDRVGRQGQKGQPGMRGPRGAPGESADIGALIRALEKQTAAIQAMAAALGKARRNSRLQFGMMVLMLVVAAAALYNNIQVRHTQAANHSTLSALARLGDEEKGSLRILKAQTSPKAQKAVEAEILHVEKFLATCSANHALRDYESTHREHLSKLAKGCPDVPLAKLPHLSDRVVYTPPVYKTPRK